MTESSARRLDVVEDTAAGVVGIALSVLPGPFGAIWSLLVGSSAQRRLERDLHDVQAAIAALEERGAIPDLTTALASEQFLAGLMSTLQAMSATADSRKREYLRNALINGSVLDPSSYDEYFFRLMRDYDAEHVLILGWTRGLPAYCEEDMPESGIWRDLEQEALDQRVLGDWSAARVHGVLSRLASDGLLQRSARLTNVLFDSGAGDRADSISDLGLDFLRAVSLPS